MEQRMDAIGVFIIMSMRLAYESIGEKQKHMI